MQQQAFFSRHSFATNTFATSAGTRLCTLAGALALALTAHAADTATPSSSAPRVPAQNTQSSVPTTVQSKEFVEAVGAALTTQVEISKLVASETQDAKVREYAQWIVKDYEPALAHLEKLATDAKLALPSANAPAPNRIVDTYKQKNAAQRDGYYLDLMQAQHDNAIAACERAHGTSEIAVEFRDFADKLLPTLRQYRKRAEKVVQMTPTVSSSTATSTK